MSVSLEVENLSVFFGQPDGTMLQALGPLSLEVPEEQFVCLVGPSGCGKSTLIRAISGLVQASSGRILIDSKPIDGPSPLVGMMFQQANLMPWRTVIENVTLPMELAGVPKFERLARAMQLLRDLNLQDFADVYPGSLSGGMAQRAALGRLLSQEPEVVLLDEPLGALDAMTREQVGTDLLNLWRETKQTALMVTHDINEAIYLADRVLVMSQRPGHIIGDFNITLPRPRHADIRYELGFGELAKQIRNLIQLPS